LKTRLLERRQQICRPKDSEYRFAQAGCIGRLLDGSGFIEALLGSDLVAALGVGVARRMEAVREEAQEARPRAVEPEILRVCLAGLVMMPSPDIVGVGSFDLRLLRAVCREDNADESSVPSPRDAGIGRRPCRCGSSS